MSHDGNGVKWRIGRGENVCIWHDRWLMGPKEYKIEETPIRSDMQSVSKLINQANRTWDVPTITSVFACQDAQHILCVPLLANAEQDMIVWLGEQIGESNTILGTTSNGYNAFYKKKKWQVTCPLKIKIMTYDV